MYYFKYFVVANSSAVQKDLYGIIALINLRLCDIRVVYYIRPFEDREISLMAFDNVGVKWKETYFKFVC